jgi:XRE family transcriptional regulator, regulator of sulfur utilization
MRIEEKIRLQRLEKGLSQENMADLLHISTTTYGDIERGKTEISVNRLQKIASILGCSVTNFFDVQLPQVIAKPNELLELEIQKLIAEKEKFELEALYWREKYEEKVLQDAYQILLNRQQEERPKIGFQRAS